MKKKCLLQEEDFSLWYEEGIPAEALTFLEEIAWGSEGAVYEHRGTAEHAQHIPNPSIIYVRQQDKIVGTAVFCNTQILAKGQAFNCFYIRYFAAAPEIRGQGLIKKFGEQVMELIRRDEQRKTVFFAAIEKGNRGSYKVVNNAGYDNIGTIKTLGFSRFFPKKSDRVERLESTMEQQKMIELLQQHYAGHTLVQFSTLFLQDGYFVIREGGEIVAGAQLHTADWVVNKMAGALGWLITTIVPYVPLLNRIFNPRDFRFCSFEGIYCKAGHEAALLELFESLLALKKRYSALFWMAEASPYFQQMKNFGQLGLIHQFVKDSDTYILASLDNMTDEEERLFSEHPMYVAAYDFI